MRFIGLLLIQLCGFSYAFGGTDCSDLYQKSGAFEFQRFQGEINCQILVSPANAGTDYYRAAVFTDEGMFMVFNSYEYSKGTDGARVFYFFPRTRMPNFEKQSNGQIRVQTSSPGVFFDFDQVALRFAGMGGGILTEDPQVRPDNAGGIELKDIQTLWLDVGFKFKGDPSADPSRSSTFRDPEGRRCEVSNSKIFTFTADGDSFFKLNDAELKTFLKTHCPGLRAPF